MLNQTVTGPRPALSILVVLIPTLLALFLVDGPKPSVAAELAVAMTEEVLEAELPADLKAEMVVTILPTTIVELAPVPPSTADVVACMEAVMNAAGTLAQVSASNPACEAIYLDMLPELQAALGETP